MLYKSVRLHVLSRVGLKVTGTAGVPEWVVGTNCVEPDLVPTCILRVTGTAGVPIWVTGNNPDLIKGTGFAVGKWENQPMNY